MLDTRLLQDYPLPVVPYPQPKRGTARMNGDYKMIKLIQDLVRFLSQEGLSVEDVVARIGRVMHEPVELVPLELCPVIAGIRSARLALYPDSELPYMLKIEFEHDVQPGVGELKSVLGDYHQALTDRGRPIEILFYPPQAGAHWNIVVIAKLATDSSEIERSFLASVILRRDPVAL